MTNPRGFSNNKTKKVIKVKVKNPKRPLNADGRELFFCPGCHKFH